ncbi:hypothetical protein ACJMK2_013053 [Sinanodonta woodiana]|uniref:Lysozyme n=1 Tax=Sinanodonta woodiana TaxID=1069815 RepID=A0ABD3VD39_SINWO
MKTMACQHGMSSGVLSIIYILVSHWYWPQVTSATTDFTGSTSPGYASSRLVNFAVTSSTPSSSLITSSSPSFQSMQSTLATRSKIKIIFRTPENRAKETDTTPFSTSRCTTKRPVKKPCLTKKKDFWQKLRIQIIIDEGYVKVIYVTPNGIPHFGIGHKITRQEPEFYAPVGTKIGRKRIEEAYRSDMKSAIESCCTLFKDFQNLPDEVQLIVLNMRFNMGHAGMNNFVKFINAINSRDWKQAAQEVEKSRWYKIVTSRAKRLVDRLKSVPQDSEC